MSAGDFMATPAGSYRAYGLRHRLRSSLFVRGTLDSRRGKVGACALVLLVLLVIVGPLVSPYSPTAIVGPPFAAPSLHHLLGTDELGRDGLSRFVWGGGTLLIGTVVSTLVAYAAGIAVGMAAGYRQGSVEVLSVALVDLLIAFPPLVLLLMLVAGAGTGLWVSTFAVALIQFPRVVRIVRTVTLNVSTREFVEASVARGEPVRSILRRDILPNIWTPIMADFGIRLGSSALLFASLSYLGLGPAPPAANWGLMISENQTGVLVQPWVVVAPALAIAYLTVAVSLMADSIARSVGQSTAGRDV